MHRCFVCGAAALVGAAGLSFANDDLGQLFDVAAWSEQALDVPLQAGEAFEVTIRLGDADRRFRLEPWSLRAPDAAAYEVRGGIRRAIMLPAPVTYRGRCLDDPSVEAAGSVRETGLTLTIVDREDNPDDNVYWAVAPVAQVVDDAPREAHIVYNATDDIAEGHCGGAIGVAAHEGGSPVELSQFEIEMAFDADLDYFQLNGSDIGATIADIDTVMVGVTIVYERDIDATFRSTAYLVRTDTVSNPYTSTNPSTMLIELRNDWRNNQADVHRDAAHLFTGRDLDAGVIGISWVGSLCTGVAYGVSQGLFTQSINSRVALVAHEIGHNAGASHCTDDNCHLMCAYLNGCGGPGDPPRFGNRSRNTIRAFLGQAPCIDPPMSCPGDLTGDGGLNTNDFFLFLDLYQAGDPLADFEPGGGINSNDFFAFLVAYQAGC